MDIKQPFLINRRFLIDLSRHSIYNLETQSVTRLELRQVNLLGQLCRNNGKLVERDFLIKEIWHDYSGADEALTQGISVLRKTLADEQKELIKTIPKKGYIFQAELSDQQPLSIIEGQPLALKNSRVWVYRIVSGVLILVVLLIFLRLGGIPKQVKPGKGGDKKFYYAPAPTPKPAPTEQKGDKRRAKHTSPPAGEDDTKKTTI